MSYSIAQKPDRDWFLPAVAGAGIGGHCQFGSDGHHHSTQYPVWRTSGQISDEKHGNEGRASEKDERDSQWHQSAQTLRLGTLLSGELLRQKKKKPKKKKPKKTQKKHTKNKRKKDDDVNDVNREGCHLYPAKNPVIFQTCG